MFQARSTTSVRSSKETPSPSSMAAAATTASGATLSTSTDSNLDDDPNSSIISKLRSGVTSIIPDALSKWFSPASAKRPRDNIGTNTTPSGRNGNLLRLRRRDSSSSDPDERTTMSENEDIQSDHNIDRAEDEEEDDEDHAPPKRKKKRTEENLHTSLTDFRQDLNNEAGPSGLNISAITGRRSSLLSTDSKFSRTSYRGGMFSSSTPSTSPQSVSTADGPARKLLGQPQTTTSSPTVSSYSSGFSRRPIVSEASNASVVTNSNNNLTQMESLSSSIRHRRSIQEVSNRKRLNIPPMAADRSTSEPPAAFFGKSSSNIFGRINQLSIPQNSREQFAEEVSNVGREELEDKTLSNGNLNESASESSSVSNLNLSQTEPVDSRRLSSFMGNNRSKRFRVGGSTGDLCFSSHLETEKSLFSSKNENRVGRPSFNASLYGSTSSLGSTNSSLFAKSPFYNGKTMYGGAAAYSTQHRDIRQKALRIPVQMRPSSSLSNFSSSNTSLASDTSALSNTAKRILDIMNQCSGPLNEARKLGSSLSLNSALASAKVPGLVQARRRFNEEDLTINRSIRLSSPRTPYSRPLSATGHSTSSLNKPPTTELQIPSQSQMLQMKRLQVNTESVRRLATESIGSTALNEITEYKLPRTSDDDKTKYSCKMRNKLHRVREESNTDRSQNTPMPQIVLPDVQLTGLKSVPKFDIKLPVSSAAATKSSNVTATSNKTTINIGEKSSTLTTACSNVSSVKTSISEHKRCASTQSISLPTLINNCNYKFSEPIKLNLPASSSSITKTIKGQNNFKFSNPELIKVKTVTPSKIVGFKCTPEVAELKVSTTVPNTVAKIKAPVPLKSGSCLDALKTPVSSQLPTTSCFGSLTKSAVSSAPSQSTSTGFGDVFKLTGSNKWECDTCMIRNDPDKQKCVACETPKPSSSKSNAKEKTPLSKPSSDAGFQALVAQQSSKWECSDCMTRNDSTTLKCVCCEKPKPGAATTPVAASVPAAVQSMFAAPSSSTSSVFNNDQSFKTLAAQQAANKWECSVCMTRNESFRSKCACCEQAKPGSTTSDTPSFSFGSKQTSTNSKVGSAASESKGGFSFGITSTNTTSLATTTTSSFTFGTGSSATSSGGKSQFSFGAGPTTTNTVGSGFSSPVKTTTDITDGSNKTAEKKDDSKNAEPCFSSRGFAFGAKVTSSGETKKSDPTVTSSTVSTGSTSTGFSFGSPTVKPTADASKSSGFSFGKPAETSLPVVSSSSSNGNTVEITKPSNQPVTFGSLFASSANATPTTAVTIAVTTTAAGTATFSFGSLPVTIKPAITSTPSTNTDVSSKPNQTTLTGGLFSFGASKSLSSPSETDKTTATAVVVKAVEKKDTSLAADLATTAKSTPIFGGTQKATAPSITPSFSFGSAGSNTVSTVSSTGSSTTVPTFSFGGATTKPAETITSTSTSTTTTATSTQSFVFGQNVQFANKVIPSFGAVTSTTAAADKPIFGSFGMGGSGNSASSSPSTGGSIFGRYGYNTSTTTTAPNPTESTAPPAFTFATNKSTTAVTTAPTTSLFGAPSKAVSKPVFGSTSANTPTFGAFGGNVTGATSAPTFGSSAAFGVTSPPVFGSGSPSTGGIFGQTIAAPFESAVAASAPFGGGRIASNSSATSSPFGANTTAAGVTAPSTDEPPAKKAFEFGSNANVNSQQVTPFQFSASGNNNNNNDNSAKPFAFSAHSAPNFNFTAGSNAPQTAAPVATTAFQFGAVPAPQANPFAPTNISGQGPQQQAARRKIRAARRINPR